MATNPITNSTCSFEMLQTSASTSKLRNVMTTPQDLQQAQRKLEAMSPVDRPSPLTAVCPRPIPNSYWATPLLLACEYPWAPHDSHKLDALLRAGVRTFIDLTESGELRPYFTVLNERASLLGISDMDAIEYHRFPIRDRSLPSSLNQIHSILNILAASQAKNRISAVHCRGGIGRTGLVVGCWLVQSGLATDGEEALRIIAKEWKGVEKCTRFPHSPETGEQETFVRNWKIGLELKAVMGVGSGLTVTGGLVRMVPGL